MQVHVKRLAREPIVEDDFAADKGFKWEGSEHVESETKTGDIDHGVVRGKVVKDVAFREGAEGEEAGESHEQACQHRDGGAIMSYAGEAVYSGCFQGPIDEEGVVVADERWWSVSGELRVGVRVSNRRRSRLLLGIFHC